MLFVKKQSTPVIDDMVVNVSNQFRFLIKYHATIQPE